jgi:hypothetical protein
MLALSYFGWPCLLKYLETICKRLLLVSFCCFVDLFCSFTQGQQMTLAHGYFPEEKIENTKYFFSHWSQALQLTAYRSAWFFSINACFFWYFSLDLKVRGSL